MSVVYLFTRYRFNWGEVEFSIFSTYGMITGLIGIQITFLTFIYTNCHLLLFHIYRDDIFCWYTFAFIENR